MTAPGTALKTGQPAGRAAFRRNRAAAREAAADRLRRGSAATTCAEAPRDGRATASAPSSSSCGDAVTFVITGVEGRADEDLACARYIAARATGTEAGSAEYVRRAAGSRAAAELATGVRRGVHPDDIALCLEVDRFAFAMVAAPEGALTVLRPHGAPHP